MISHNYAFPVKFNKLKDLHRYQTHTKLELIINKSFNNYQIQDQSKCYSHINNLNLTLQENWLLSRKIYLRNIFRR